MTAPSTVTAAAAGRGSSGRPEVTPPVPPALGATLDRLAADPDAPFVLGVAGDGGTGKSAGLAALRRTLRAADVPVTSLRGAVDGRWPGSPSARGGALLVDDAHRLDDGALAQLLALLDDDDARVAVAFRGWPRPPLLGVVAREVEVRGGLVTLGALDRAQVAARAAARLGRTPPASLVDHVLRATGGVPRWVDLLLAGSPVAGPATAQGARPTTAQPWDLQVRIEEELGPADGAVRSLVLAVAVGAVPDVGSLAVVLGLAPDRAHAALAEARGAGLLRGDGSPPPVVRQAVLAAAPADRVRELVAASVRADLDRGAAVETVAARLAGVPVPSPDLAALLRRAAHGVRSSDPGRAAALLAAACDADPAGVDAVLMVERAECEALAGDVDTALRLVTPLVEGAGRPGGVAATTGLQGAQPGPPGASSTPPDAGSPSSAARRRAAAVMVAVLGHRGLLEQAAGVPAAVAPAPAAAVLAALGCGLDEAARGAGDPAGAPPAGDPTALRSPRDSADRLVVAALRASLVGDGGGCLPLLGRASVLLRGAGDPAPAPDTPEAVAAVAAISSGDVGHAQRVLRAAVATRAGGPLAAPRHALLLAWCAMLGGAFGVARRHVGQAIGGGRPLAGRDELLRQALELGIARRAHDPAALVRTWPAARQALLGHGVDLFMLLPLGEITVAAARLDETHRVSATLEEAYALLARCGEPVLWAMPLHWAGVHAAIAAERPDAVAPHAAALVRGARVSRHALTLSDAGRAWMQVLAGRVDAPGVERAARRLHAAGLGWDGSRLAAHAAARADDHRAASQLLQVARDLQRAGPEGERAASPAGVPGVGAGVGPGTGVGTRVGTGATGGSRPGDGPAGAAGTGTGTGAGPGGSRPDAAPVHAVAAPRAVGTEVTVPLSEREVQVAHLVLAGHTYREISERLYISTKTVEHHVARMRQRLGLESRAALLAHLRAHLDPYRAG